MFRMSRSLRNSARMTQILPLEPVVAVVGATGTGKSQVMLIPSTVLVALCSLLDNIVGGRLSTSFQRRDHQWGCYAAL